MSKKVYITEDQLNEILSGSYLEDPEGTGKIKDGNYSEITTNPLPEGEPVTTDDFGHEECASPFWRYYFNSRSPYPAAGAMTMESTAINEVADGVKNKHYKVSGPLRDKMMRNYQSTNGRTIGTKRLEKLLNDEGASENYLSNLLSDINAGRVSNEELQLLGGQDFVRWMNQNIKNRQNLDASMKKTQHDMGVENVYQKAGGTKDESGTAHTPKNGGEMTYDFGN